MTSFPQLIIRSFDLWQKGVETVEWIGSKFVKEFCFSIHDNLSEVWFVGEVVV